MIKKYLLIALLLVMAAVTASAGTWKIHNYYVGSRIQNVYDTGDKIYYLNSGSLFQFDKATTTTVALSAQNKLSDSQIGQIYYDWQNQLLFVAYLDCNIDIIDKAGAVYNISKLKDIVVDVRNYTLDSNVLVGYTGKSINDITFEGGVAYVAVDYGYVTIDEATKTITGNNKVMTGSTGNVNSVAVVGNSMVIVTNDACYYGPVGTENPISSYKKLTGSFTGSKIYPINQTSFFVMYSKRIKTVDLSTGNASITTLISTSEAVTPSVQKTPTGFIANYPGQKYYYVIDAAGKTATKASSTIACATAYPQGDGTVWINDAAGLHPSGSSQNYAVNALTTNEPYWLKYNSALDKLYVCTTALNGLTRTRPDNYAPNVINVYDGTTWTNQTPFSATGSGYQFVFNPLDSATYFRSSWASGIHRVKNNSLVFTYNSSNSLMGKYKAHPAFDKYGNMWIVSSYKSADCPVAVLPKSKVAKSSVTKSDWFQPSGLLTLNTDLMQRSRFVISKKSNVKIYNDGDYKSMMFCWDNFNEDPTVDDYKLASFIHFTDQNNRQVDWTYLLHMEEDLDGLIWAGSTSGLFVFDPEHVFDDYPKAISPFVTRGPEGKGYLCEGNSVYDIGVDRDNNKWIATGNGLYYVSPDGTEVYNHFTTSNSDIPSNTVYAVECDTRNNRVYIYTNNAFAEYVTGVNAAASSFDNVYAYPNPVGMDFTGMITIANLMADSYVTITDRDGNVVKQLGPVTGSALWDGCGNDGDRVSTGLYHIYAAQGGQPAVTGTPQATVMVIK